MTNFQPAIDYDWLRSQSADDYVASLIHRGKRKLFGLLEHPSLPPNKSVDTVRYKIFVCGKANVGKSSTVAKLAGGKVRKSVSETPGIETTVVHWPVRLIATGQVVFFCLHFWDVGDNAVKKFDHILPACKEEADCILFMFSFTDRTSFSEVHHYMNRMIDGIERQPAQVIVGTKADQYIHSDISDAEIQDLSESRNAAVLRIKNFPFISGEGYESIKDVAPFLNKLCDILWTRDQRMSNMQTASQLPKQSDVLV